MAIRKKPLKYMSNQTHEKYKDIQGKQNEDFGVA